jgi:glutathione peroxidase-family protein
MTQPRRTTIALILIAASSAAAFTTTPHRQFLTTGTPLAAAADGDVRSNVESEPSNLSNSSDRRAFLTALSSFTFSVNIPPALAEGEGDNQQPSAAFESIAARAAKVSQEVSEAEIAQKAVDAEAEERRKELAKKIQDDPRTIYDFTLPVKGKEIKVGDIVGQTYGMKDSGDGWTDGAAGGVTDSALGTTVKAILVVNIKQDDPIARKNIPELIALAKRFGKNGDFAVIVSPTDQGYYEPDTSALIRLKMESEYGYGSSSPGTYLTDKVNLLGSGAVPFWRWIEGSCRTPAGLGKIQANFEKFLVDGRTGKPIRRYPRKYQPYDIADDIAAVVAGRPLPPAGANFKEEWRNAAKEAENDTYRFQKGLNYFDQ